MTRAWHSVVRPGQTCAGETEGVACALGALIIASPQDDDPEGRNAGAMLPRAPWGCPGGVGGRGCRRLPLGDLVEEPDDRPKPLEVQEVLSRGPGRAVGGEAVVGAAQGDGGVAPVREPDDDVGIGPPAQADDLDAPAAEGVVRVGDGDESRRGRG